RPASRWANPGKKTMLLECRASPLVRTASASSRGVWTTPIVAGITRFLSGMLTRPNGDGVLAKLPDAISPGRSGDATLATNLMRVPAVEKVGVIQRLRTIRYTQPLLTPG